MKLKDIKVLLNNPNNEIIIIIIFVCRKLQFQKDKKLQSLYNYVKLYFTTTFSAI